MKLNLNNAFTYSCVQWKKHRAHFVQYCVLLHAFFSKHQDEITDMQMLSRCYIGVLRSSIVTSTRVYTRLMQMECLLSVLFCSIGQIANISPVPNRQSTILSCQTIMRHASQYTRLWGYYRCHLDCWKVSLVLVFAARNYLSNRSRRCSSQFIIIRCSQQHKFADDMCRAQRDYWCLTNRGLFYSQFPKESQAVQKVYPC